MLKSSIFIELTYFMSTFLMECFWSSVSKELVQVKSLVLTRWKIKTFEDKCNDNISIPLKQNISSNSE